MMLNQENVRRRRRSTSPRQTNVADPELINQDAHGPGAADASSPSSSIDAWLDVLTGLMRVPEPDRLSIRAELAEHLRERVRDLMLSGRNEATAMREAVEELGEIAELARRFESARQSNRRRNIMNAAMLGLTAVIATTGVLMIAPSTPGPNFAAVYEAAPDQTPPPPEAGNARLSLETDDTPRDYFAELARTIDLGLTVDWGEIAEAGFEPDDPIGISANNITVLQSLEFLQNASEQRGGALFDWRFTENMLVLGTRSQFDRRERMLVNYSIADIIADLQQGYNLNHIEAVRQVLAVIHQLVESENWVARGGVVGETVVVGGNLFVKAPPRMHKQLVWILEQIRDEHEANAHRDGRAGVQSVGAGGAGGAGGAAGAPGATGAGGTGMRIPGAGRPAPSPGGAR